jgi:ATP-dependent DNA helicase RecQ
MQRLTEQRETEWEEVQSYIDATGCLMKFLARALDDPEPRRCGKCSSCLGRPVVSPSFSREGVVGAARFLRHAEIPLECRKQVPKSAFVEYNFMRNLPTALRAETGRILSRWGDAGWGQFVAEDKHKGYFRDELVQAVSEMIRERWRPDPAPTWVTCIPSQIRPSLVPDFAERLAGCLAISFIRVVKKIKRNEPQKSQQNSFYQCRNLDGAFSIDRQVPDGPVLLIDDVVDSGWTLTVAATLLRRAGSGPVWPVALTTSNIGA